MQLLQEEKVLDNQPTQKIKAAFKKAVFLFLNDNKKKIYYIIISERKFCVRFLFNKQLKYYIYYNIKILK